MIGHDGSDSGDDAATLGAQLALATARRRSSSPSTPRRTRSAPDASTPSPPRRASTPNGWRTCAAGEEVREHARASSRGAACRRSTAWSGPARPRTGSTTSPRPRALDDRRRLLAARRAAAHLPRLDRRAAAARGDLPGRGRAARACASGRRTRRCGGSASPTVDSPEAGEALRVAAELAAATNATDGRRQRDVVERSTPVVAGRRAVGGVAPVIGRDAEISFLATVREGRAARRWTRRWPRCPTA